MTRQEYYEYCFECECNGEIQLIFEGVNQGLNQPSVEGFIAHVKLIAPHVPGLPEEIQT